MVCYVRYVMECYNMYGMLCQLFPGECQEKFPSDSSKQVIRTYIDLEMIDKLPLLYNYFVISAHFNKSTKVLCYTKVTVIDKVGTKFLVACLLRTKCVKPRYDVVLIPMSQTAPPFRVVGLSKFKESYKYDLKTRMLLWSKRCWSFFETKI